MSNINDLSGARQFPNWNQRGKIKKVSPKGDLIDGEYAYGGEVVRISPRFQRSGQNYRIRPERPATFFAAWCFENGLLPTPLAPEECEQEWALEILGPLWEAHKHHFPKLESPFAACDTRTVPSYRTGFSFNILQVLVEPMGSIRTPASLSSRLAFDLGGNGSSNNEALKKKIEEMRSRQTAPANATTTTVPAKPKR